MCSLNLSLFSDTDTLVTVIDNTYFLSPTPGRHTELLVARPSNLDSPLGSGRSPPDRNRLG